MSNKMRFVGYAAALLFAILLVANRIAFESHVNTELCKVGKLVAERQVVTIQNLIESSHEFRDYETEPHIQAFFETSARQREASLVIAKADVAQYKC